MMRGAAPGIADPCSAQLRTGSDDRTDKRMLHKDCSEALTLLLQVKLTTVIGKPIEVPKIPEASKEEVQKHLDHFIAEMKELFERHKASAGYPDLQLTVI